jgi:hypothetical protein
LEGAVSDRGVFDGAAGLGWAVLLDRSGAAAVSVAAPLAVSFTDPVTLPLPED